MTTARPIFSGQHESLLVETQIQHDRARGPIEKLSLPHYVEAPWVHQRGGLYYLSYAWGFPERTAYATAEKITGPWTYRGIITELVGNCNTNHQAIIEFKAVPISSITTAARPPAGVSAAPFASTTSTTIQTEPSSASFKP